MEKRMEKWESLRLEAQQFTPQEFVAQCTDEIWVIETVVGNVWYSLDQNNNKTYEDDDTHGGYPKNINPQSKTLHFTEEEYQHYLDTRQWAFYKVGGKPEFTSPTHTPDAGWYYNAKGGGHGGNGIFIVDAKTEEHHNFS
jgi:hypothetical protein